MRSVLKDYVSMARACDGSKACQLKRKTDGWIHRIQPPTCMWEGDGHWNHMFASAICLPSQRILLLTGSEIWGYSNCPSILDNWLGAARLGSRCIHMAVLGI